MCIRLRVLKRPLQMYLGKNDMKWLRLTAEEWSHIDYLISLTAPFNAFTQTIGRSKSPSIHRVYEIYNLLFNHIEHSIRVLQRKRDPWKLTLKDALQASREKLQKYYSETGILQSLDCYYAFTWLLHPTSRNQAFVGSSWTGLDYRRKYMKALREKWVTEYKGDTDNIGQPSVQSEEQDPLDLVRSLHHQRIGHFQPVQSAALTSSKSKDELHRYFELCMLLITVTSIAAYLFLGDSRAKDPLAAWRENKNYEQFPTVARMARDYLCSPAATVGVERTFYHARCQSEFNRTYSAKTFSAIMMCKLRMVQEEEQEEEKYIELLASLGDVGLSLRPEEVVREADTRKQHTDAVLGSIHHELISDDEDDGDGNKQGDEIDCISPSIRSSENILGKRSRSIDPWAFPSPRARTRTRQGTSTRQDTDSSSSIQRIDT